MNAPINIRYVVLSTGLSTELFVKCNWLCVPTGILQMQRPWILWIDNRAKAKESTSLCVPTGILQMQRPWILWIDNRAKAKESTSLQITLCWLFVIDTWLCAFVLLFHWHKGITGRLRGRVYGGRGWSWLLWRGLQLYYGLLFLLLGQIPNCLWSIFGCAWQQEHCKYKATEQPWIFWI